MYGFPTTVQVAKLVAGRRREGGGALDGTIQSLWRGFNPEAVTLWRKAKVARPPVSQSVITTLLGAASSGKYIICGRGLI